MKNRFLKIFFEKSMSRKLKNHEIPAYGRRGHSLTACNAAQPAKSKMAAMGPKMANGVWKGAYPAVFGHSQQLSLKKLFYLSTPSMRKGCDGGPPDRWNDACSCQKHILGGGDIAHTLLMGEQLGWGHRTTLKENSEIHLNWVVGSGCLLQEIIPLYGPTYKLGLARSQVKLDFQVGPECGNTQFGTFQSRCT